MSPRAAAVEPKLKRRLPGARQREPEGAATPFFAAHADAAALLLDVVLGDGEADATAATALPLSLHLINSGLINDRLLDPTGRLSRVLADEESLRLERLYLVTLSRPPTADERRQWRTLMESAEDADAFWNDVFWSLLNCEEFTTNH